ncbi:hypothetical protein [Cedecea lapagei]|uniref:hypothetical protein n=1 Tax=Cedecea lapagei TaxID=158823 RepID=UPI001BCE6FCC|nr:hypothetical protein [Cedecea lapagei]
MARLRTVTDNTEVKTVLEDFMSFYDLPDWMQDIIRGSAGQVNTGNRGISSSSIFRLIQSLTEISTLSVADIINPRYKTVHGKEMSTRMVEYYTAAARNASQAISHQLVLDNYEVTFKEGESFNYWQDMQAYYAQNPNSQRFI